eukprot:998901-Pelagomonas_calceolata.AAC.1
MNGLHHARHFQQKVLPSSILETISGYNPQDTNSKKMYLSSLATWDDAISPACDLCDAHDDVQSEQHVLFKRTHPH